MNILFPSPRPVFLALFLAVAATARAEPAGPAAELIRHLHMQKIPAEGPWFTVTYKSDDVVPAGSLPARYHGAPHVAGSAIYCLETREDFSALHLLQTDEIWHYYGGDPLEILLLYPDGHGETAVIGPDVLHGQHAQFTVPRGVWQGSRPIGAGPDSYTFFGTTLGPGFEYGDFAIGYRDELQKLYPKFATQIAALTRGEFATRPATAAPVTGSDEKTGAPGDFDARSEPALQAMRDRAGQLHISGVAVIAFFAGPDLRGWSSKMSVVGRYQDAPSAKDAGANLLGIAYAKAAEMAVTLKNSGHAGRPPLTGEFGWPGGVIREWNGGYVLAAFSGGKSEDDVEVSRAGAAAIAEAGR